MRVETTLMDNLGDGTTINKMSFAKIIDSGVSSVSTNSGTHFLLKVMEVYGEWAVIGVVH